MLRPIKVGISAEFKYFGLDTGKSISSAATMEFSVDEGMERDELLKRMLEEREKLELQLLLASVVKGAISHEYYKETKATIKTGYEKIKAQIRAGSSPTENGERVVKDKARVADDIGDALGK